MKWNEINLLPDRPTDRPTSQPTNQPPGPTDQNRINLNQKRDKSFRKLYYALIKWNHETIISIGLRYLSMQGTSASTRWWILAMFENWFVSFSLGDLNACVCYVCAHCMYVYLVYGVHTMEKRWVFSGHVEMASFLWSGVGAGWMDGWMDGGRVLIVVRR